MCATPRARACDREFHVVALSIPIVYTREGDHDPNGMVYALGPVATLLRWARDRWEDDDDLLARLHVRRQRAQLVVDGLERLEEMLWRLRNGPEDDQLILAELIRRESLPEYPEAEDRGSHGPRRGGGRGMAVRLNVQRQIEELRVALTDLGNPDGLNGWSDPVRIGPPGDDAEDAEPQALDPDTAPQPIRLVTLSSASRQAWRAEWQAQARLLDQAIEHWFTACEADPDRRFDAHDLACRSRIPEPWVRRLLLNDHAPGTPIGQPCDRFNPMKPIPALRPLVLRCRDGERVRIRFENSISGRRVGFHVQGGRMSGAQGDGVCHADGAAIGQNADSTCRPGETITLHYSAEGEGVWPINDLGDVRGSERGTNAHGLFGALVVEAGGARWRDAQTGDDLTDADWCSLLDVDVIAAGEDIADAAHRDFVDFHHDAVPRSFREFTVFIHDEPEVHSGLHTVGEHSIMPLSYRAEPMHNRVPHRMRELAHATTQRALPQTPDAIDRSAVRWLLGDELQELFQTARTGRGDWLEWVAGEEQHHSAWLFGDPVTHVNRAYAGDPCRVRLVHGGVKETHVYHLHVHQWRAVAIDTAAPSAHGIDPATGAPRHKGSQLLDSITIGPQCGMTIDPLYGSGSRQHAMGDIVWHCHLYPHFHHGMWGLWRSHDRLVDGSRPYPDGSRCPPLRPLPGRIPPASTALQPGFPWFIDGVYPMKSPPPPVGDHTPLNGRRLLLRMPPASALERAAMPLPCREGRQPGAVFVDLDGQAGTWNQKAGLPVHPRIVSYDIEVRASHCSYNADGWHDPRAHYYRLAKVGIREWSAAEGAYREIHSESFAYVPDHNPSPLFPRANHGDIVEWRQHNSLGSFAADGFDHAQLPVECGLHVHLVKFDVLAADGSATGWNYLSGASCREAVGADGAGEWRTTSLHRWVVDEEFGPCFFHDHLLANFRQKHGLFAAFIAEPHGAQWHRADDQGITAWGDAEAVVVPPPGSGLPPFREACLAIGDFVPLLDKGQRPLNPPSTLSGDDDPGSMAVNYRCAPMTFRGPDPSQWFSARARSRPNMAGQLGEPDTPIIRTYPGERLRLRLIQGSHEEQHGIAVHGMRWRRDWGNRTSTLVNQQTLGISEGFTLDIDPADASPYGVGDHLWHFCALDDLWLGCWGYIRSLAPIAENFECFSPLPSLTLSPAEQRQQLRGARAAPELPAADAANVRRFVVVAQRTEHLFHDTALSDPWGLIYRPMAYDDDAFRAAHEQAITEGLWPADNERVVACDEPLVLRARRGEWIHLVLVNDLIDEDDDEEDDGLIEFGVEPSPARLPLEHLDALSRPDRRTVSSRVSIHPSLLRYDVARFDGSHVGLNFDGTVASRHRFSPHTGSHLGEQEIPGAVIHRGDHSGRRNWREYWWYADEQLAPASHADGPGQVCYLHDMADIRNHRHHGLIGALIVLPGDVTPFAPGPDAEGAQGEAWSGMNAQLRTTSGEVVAYDTAVFVQDGLRFFVHGNPDFPLPDPDPTDDPEDSGQKAINYRSHPVHHGKVLDKHSTTFPLLQVPAGATVWLRVIGAGDKPRQHTIVAHGCRWPEAPWAPQGAWTGAITGLSPCRVETVPLHLPHAGDYAVRAGAFRWASEHGIWSMVRALPVSTGGAADPVAEDDSAARGADGVPKAESHARPSPVRKDIRRRKQPPAG